MGAMVSPPCKEGWREAPGGTLLLSLSATRQYPSKPIRLVVTFPPGGITDFTARALAPRLAERSASRDRSDRTGPGGNIGTDFVAKARRRHTLLVAGRPTDQRLSLYKALPFDTKKDRPAFRRLVGSGANVPVSAEDARQQTVRRASSSTPNAASGQAQLRLERQRGTSHAIFGRVAQVLRKVDAVHVPFRGAPAAMTALLARVMWISCSMRSPFPRRRSARARSGCSRSPPRAQRDVPRCPDLGRVGLFPSSRCERWTGVMTTGEPRSPSSRPAGGRAAQDPLTIASDQRLSKTRMTASFAGAREFANFSTRRSGAGGGGEAFRWQGLRAIIAPSTSRGADALSMTIPTRTGLKVRFFRVNKATGLV